MFVKILRTYQHIYSYFREDGNSNKIEFEVKEFLSVTQCILDTRVLCFVRIDQGDVFFRLRCIHPVTVDPGRMIVELSQVDPVLAISTRTVTLSHFSTGRRLGWKTATIGPKFISVLF